MKQLTFEVRACPNCGLRYPITEGHAFGKRCPQCRGETQLVLKKSVSEESATGTGGGGRRGFPLAVLLDNIRSAWNVGSILRSADGFGFEHAYLCGITPTPENEAVRKTSLGAENLVEWSCHKDALKLVEGLKAEGWGIFALEAHEAAKNMRNAGRIPQAPKRLLVVGNEVTGVDPGLLELCDEVLCIPMRGGKRSFNAAVAFGIAAFALTENV